MGTVTGRPRLGMNAGSAEAPCENLHKPLRIKTHFSPIVRM
jgi:hypothetical protein